MYEHKQPGKTGPITCRLHFGHHSPTVNPESCSTAPQGFYLGMTGHQIVLSVRPVALQDIDQSTVIMLLNAQ